MKREGERRRRKKKTRSHSKKSYFFFNNVRRNSSPPKNVSSTLLVAPAAAVSVASVHVRPERGRVRAGLRARLRPLHEALRQARDEAVPGAGALPARRLRRQGTGQDHLLRLRRRVDEAARRGVRHVQGTIPDGTFKLSSVANSALNMELGTCH